MPRTLSLRLRALAVACCLLPASLLHAQEQPIIAAAAQLQFAMPAIADQFEADTGQQVRLNFGSSGNLRRQIAQGAPFELYLSADESYVEALHADGHTEDAGRLYAIGRLVIVAPDGGDALVDGSLAGLRAALAEGTVDRFAIANPTHAPYGVAAREALEATGLWDLVEPRLVYGESVAQAARYAVSDETQGGIIALALVKGERSVATQAGYALIPGDLHTPLRHRMALLKGAGDTARAFHDYLLTEPARTILRDYGFELPPGD